MKKNMISGAIALTIGLLAGFSQKANAQDTSVLQINKQGVFSSGGTVTAPLPGEYDATKNWLDTERKGTTTHVDHANTFYQIPADGSGTPMVFLHGYGQTRTGW